MLIILAGFFVFGFVFALKLNIGFQLMAFAIGMAYMTSQLLKSKELEGLFDLAMFILFCIGMVVADIYFAIFFSGITGASIINGLKWFVTP